MSEENVALARKAIDALNRGDFDALLAFLSPDVVWEALEGVPGVGELYRGRTGARVDRADVGKRGGRPHRDRANNRLG
jgi:ketosteroid isomerase-like protein